VCRSLRLEAFVSQYLPIGQPEMNVLTHASKGKKIMQKRYVRRLGLVAIVALALALGGCGSSKKGNGGYSYVPPAYPGAPAGGHALIG
jgi:hypothetical protein